MKDLYQSADWKKEKHVPVIQLPAQASAGEPVQVTLSVGEEIAHPNTTAHHIEWIELYFHPAGEKFPYLVGRFTFSAHGASAEGPDSSTVYAQPRVVCALATEKPGTLHAASYCNIHGLWSNSAELTLG
jgi:superoxide reductase